MDQSFMETSSVTSSPRLQPVTELKADTHDIESGYGSAFSSTTSLPTISLTKSHLSFLNEQLEKMEPMDILRFCMVMFPNLYQSTAFGLTGLATLDMLSKLRSQTPQSQSVNLIFLDTLYHFQETYNLLDRVKERYPNVDLHIFKPYGVETAQEFEDLYGEKLYESESEMYDWTAKVEPMQRAYEDLRVAAVLTGRRRSQGGARDKMPIIEVDEERGVLKINPLATWSFSQVQGYIREHNVPYNELLDQGYKSIGDWHSTSPVGEGEDERAGRWKGQAKTECGIHNKKSRYAQYLEDMDRKTQEEKLAATSAALDRVNQEAPLVSVA
jgi:phosphoadenosine phosphosulfate reductase